MKTPTIIQAIKDPRLFRDFLADADGDIESWLPWCTALRCLYGLHLDETMIGLVRQCTGRNPCRMPAEGFDSALFLTGRRCGKSRIAAVIGAYSGILSGLEQRLAKGEKGLVAVVAPTVKQARIVHGYMRAIFSTPLLAPEVVEETKDLGYELRNGVRVEMLAGDYRSIRGYSLLGICIDEAAFLGVAEESKVRSDTELIRAVQPALATTGGKLIAISSPYARRGWTYKTWQRNYANDAGKVLVWNCPSRVMNCTLPQSVVDAALAEDLAAAKSEYLGEFRDDVGEFLPREIIERLVVADRVELPPQNGLRYVAFCDMSGGRNDSAALAIAHRDGRKVVLDLLRNYRPPFNPQEIVGRMAEELRRYSLRKVTGDAYAGEYTAAAFNGQGIIYAKCEKNKSALYTELLPRLCSQEIELLDDELLIAQLAGLERRTRSGGKDIIDHPPTGHDDSANAVAGVADCAANAPRRVGALLEYGTY